MAQIPYALRTGLTYAGDFCGRGLPRSLRRIIRYHLWETKEDSDNDDEELDEDELEDRECNLKSSKLQTCPGDIIGNQPGGKW